MRLRRVAHVAISLVLLFTASHALAGFSGTEVFIPSVGRGGGAAGSQWTTTLWIHNPSDNFANIDIYFLERNVSNPSPPVVHDSIGVMQTRRYADVMTDLFHLQKFGALRIVSSVPIIVNARVYNLPSGGEERDTQGQFYGGVPASFAIANGQVTTLLGVFQTSPKTDSQFRYNFGWVETAGGNATVRAMIFREDGTWIETKEYPSTGPYEARLYPVEDLLPSVNATNLRISLEVIAGTGKIVATGSGVANRSNDASTFEMSYRDELLGGSGAGIDTVAHDSTLTGNGTASSPLGITDGGVTGGKIAVGAVTPAKINFTEAMVGQVLKFDGVNVGWANDEAGGLSLPYAGADYSTGELFSLVNTSGNSAYLAGAHGVAGLTTIPSRSGVYGQANVNDAYGVYGTSSATGNWGYLGGADGVSGQTVQSGRSGVYGYAAQDNNGYGVFGRNVIGTYGYLGGLHGVYGYAPSAVSCGVRGESANGVGVWGVAQAGNAGSIGVFGENSSGHAWGALGGWFNNFPVGVKAYAPSSGTAYAGFFDGNVNVTGSLGATTIYKQSGSFKIDHPLDPAGKYLYHSFVESPDMMNVYNGNVVLDDHGEAWVELPEWFETLNRDFRYQLTAIGAPGPNLYVAEEVAGNRFKIAGGEPGAKVSWQLTGIRHDAWANAHRIPVEEDKPAPEQGRYLAPELFGQPPELGINFEEQPGPQR